MSHPLWKICRKYNISPNQLYFLDSCKEKIVPSGVINAEFERVTAQGRGWMTEDNQLTTNALSILNEFEGIMEKKKAKSDKEILGEDFMTKVNEYRELFPKGRFPSGELARQSANELKEKFLWFFKNNPDYNWDIVLDATEYYLYTKSLDGYKYTVTSSYFIKKTTVTKETVSKLADYCQIIIDEPELLNY